MNKNELVNEVAERANLKRSQASDAIDAFFAVVTSTLSNGDDVRCVGFGTFTTLNRAASEGRNPRTGAPMHIPASKVPKFRPGKALKDSVNK